MARFFGIIFLFFTLLSLPQHVFAASLVLKSVGGISTQSGKTTYTTWVSSPTLVGATTANAIVTIVIDGVMSSVTADGGGNWNYTPGFLSLGNHQGSVASGQESLLFTINIIVPPTLAPSGKQVLPRELPRTADPTPFIALLGGGGSLLGIGLYLAKNKFVS